MPSVQGIGHFWMVRVDTSQTIDRKSSTTTDAAITSTSTRDSTRGRSSARCTKTGGWHPGAPPSFRFWGIVSNGRSWGGLGLDVELTGRVLPELQCHVADPWHHLGGSRCTAHKVWQVDEEGITSLRKVGYSKQLLRPYLLTNIA